MGDDKKRKGRPASNSPTPAALAKRQYRAWAGTGRMAWGSASLVCPAGRSLAQDTFNSVPLAALIPPPHIPPPPQVVVDWACQHADFRDCAGNIPGCKYCSTCADVLMMSVYRWLARCVCSHALWSLLPCQFECSSSLWCSRGTVNVGYRHAQSTCATGGRLAMRRRDTPAVLRQ